MTKLIEEMTDKEKALLTHCPHCDESFKFAGSEVNEGGLCVITCGGCLGTVNYYVDWVE